MVREGRCACSVCRAYRARIGQWLFVSAATAGYPTGSFVGSGESQRKAYTAGSGNFDSRRGIGSTSAGAVGAGRCAGRSASDPVPGSGTETAHQCGHGCSCWIAPFSSIAMIDLSKVRNSYVTCGYTDLRFGIDGLAAVVTQQFGGGKPVSVLRPQDRPHQGPIQVR